jgi:hypothetical protein
MASANRAIVTQAIIARVDQFILMIDLLQRRMRMMMKTRNV